MRSTDRGILLGLVLVGLIAVFWFMLLSPKRDEVSKLDDDVASARAAVAAQQELAAYAEQAKDDYDTNYHQLVVLGKAVPGDSDDASLIEQTVTLAERSAIEFRGLKLSDEAGSAPAPAPATQTTAEPTPESEVAEAVAPASAAAPATEATAAALPIGATIGPAGLPVMPYDLEFSGSFFDIADFMAGLDGLVSTKGAGVGVNGRLLTVDGFTLRGDRRKGFPSLGAELHVTTYVAPADQGLTAGATPQAPAPGTPTPTSNTTGTTLP